MEYNLADYAMGMSPMERQLLDAQVLRRLQAGAAMQAANQQGNQFNNMAAIANMANNPSVADAAAMAAKNAQARFKPIQMGNQGFTLPATGEFVASPIYEQEQNAARNARQDLASQRFDNALELQRQRADAAMQQQQFLEEGRNARAQDRNALGYVLAEIARMRAEGAQAARADKPNIGKTLPGSEIRRLTEKESLATGFAELAESFKPDFAGTPGVAVMQNTLGKYQPLGIGARYGDQSNWWQNYNDRKNKIRNELFGSALTASEKAAFDAANINEGMEAGEIQRRLSQQYRAVASAYNKLRQNFGRAGYNMSQFEDVQVPAAPLPGSSAPSRPQKTSDAPGLNLPPGFKIIGEAP